MNIARKIGLQREPAKRPAALTSNKRYPLVNLVTVLLLATKIAAASLPAPPPAAPSWEAVARLRPTPTVIWDDSTSQRVSAAHLRTAAYARMRPLRDGSLICVYEGDGSIFAVKSRDQGKTWGKPAAVAWRQEGINMAAPDVIQLKDGSLLAAYNPRPYKIAKHRRFGIRTRKSYDGGRTWIHGRLLYEAGHEFTDGCWEPAPIQLPSGEIQLFFADEAPFAGGELDEQHIARFRSLDGGLTWTSKPEIVSFDPGGRDGMPVPLLLQGGNEMVCAVEHFAHETMLQPALLRSTLERNWTGVIGPDSPFRESPLSHFDPAAYAGAPYLCQLPSGHTLLSYQGTEDRPNRLRNADMKVWVGDARARNFRGMSVPFRIPKNKFALWGSIACLKDGTVVALTSTNAFSKGSQIWMIKGRVEMTIPFFTERVKP